MACIIAIIEQGANPLFADTVLIEGVWLIISAPFTEKLSSSLLLLVAETTVTKYLWPTSAVNVLVWLAVLSSMLSASILLKGLNVSAPPSETM